jgi:aspartate/methionine/tyrosine aminotransferase
MYHQLVDLCRAQGSQTWIAIDQTYHEFLYPSTETTTEPITHFYPCRHKLHYEKIVHIFSFSKVFGLAGWRIGYIVYPEELSVHMRKVKNELFCNILIRFI